MNKYLKTLLVVSAFTPTASIASVTTQELQQQLLQQQKQITALEQQLNSTADMLDNSANIGSSWADKTSIGGYGEIHYNNYSGDAKDDQIDAHRFVLFFSHTYSDTVKFFSELELEHSLAGDGAPGEVELEQAYIEWTLSPSYKLISGLFLLPVGFLNETHEPPTFYGVERNLVENKVIPSTWWESGAMLSASPTNNLRYDIAIHSGFDDANSIRSSRQKSAKAKANNFASTARIRYTGIEGLELAASVQHQTDISQDDGTAPSTAATLYNLQAKYTKGNFELRSLYASWDIESDDYASITGLALTGFYIEPSYKFSQNFGVFIRHSKIADDAINGDDTVTKVNSYGVNYWLDNGVVFKADFADDQTDNDLDSVNLGVGWMF